MRILSIHVLKKVKDQAIFLKSSYQLDFVSFLKRSFVKQACNFATRTVVSKMQPMQTVIVDAQDMEEVLVCAHVNKEGICTVVICDKTYPESAVMKIILEVQSQFLKLYSPASLNDVTTDQELKFPELDNMVNKYQDPKEADKLLKIESELNEIENLLHKTMSDLLDRGEKLEDLAKQSSDISDMAFNFHRKAKESNQKCCSLY